MHTGIVIKSTGSWYKIMPLAANDKSAAIDARIKGKFRLSNLPLTNPVAVGDLVDYETHEDATAIIKKIHPRKNYVVRQSPQKKRQLHLLAANIDQAVLLVTLKHPDLKLGFIDRFLLMTEPYEIPVTIVVNKVDLLNEEDMEVLGGLTYLYQDIGYPVLHISALKNQGVNDLRDLLKGRLTLISGQSGVGKSTLLNTLDPSLNIKTSSLSKYSGKGTHTTTFAEMHFLDENARIIDSPGIKTLTFNNLEPLHVAHNFKELFALSPECKFGGNCMHRNEPGCAVKKALEEGTISELRYASYLQILDEIEKQNPWERHKI